ncbi:MAG: TlpA disulfide reductase family protein [Elusimicrobiaceae bacterium]
MNFWRFLGVAAIAALLWFGLRNNAAPAFRVASESGKAVTIADYKNKVLLLFFWMPGCSACEASFPAVNRIFSQHDGVLCSVLGVVSGAALDDNLKAYADKFSFTFPLAADLKYEAARAYKVRGFPTFVLIDKKGKVRKTWIGYGPQVDSEINSEIAHLKEE